MGERPRLSAAGAPIPAAGIGGLTAAPPPTNAQPQFTDYYQRPRLERLRDSAFLSIRPIVHLPILKEEAK